MSRAWKRDWNEKESKKTGNESAKKMRVKRNKLSCNELERKELRTKRKEGECEMKWKCEERKSV